MAHEVYQHENGDYSMDLDKNSILMIRWKFGQRNPIWTGKSANLLECFIQQLKIDSKSPLKFQSGKFYTKMKIFSHLRKLHGEQSMLLPAIMTIKKGRIKLTTG